MVRNMWYNRTMPYTDKTQQKQAQHESYIRNKEKVIAASKQKRNNKDVFLRQLKESNPCTDCGVYYPYFVMDFDHRGEKEKSGAISRLIRTAGLNKVLTELEKCDLVCANCHRYRTQNRF